MSAGLRQFIRPGWGVRRWPRPLLALGLLMLCSRGVQAQETPGHGVPKRYARDVHLLIETDRTTYRPGDRIGVRVSFVNTTDKRIAFFPTGTAYDTELIVTGPDGRRVRPNVPKAPPVATSGAPAVILPHQTLPWGWANDEWLSLSDWGYGLQSPGTYTVRGLPQLGYPNLDPDNRTVRSNAVTITIAP